MYKLPITGLSLSRWEQPTEPLNCYVMDASLCLIAQGQFYGHAALEIYTHDASHFLFTAVRIFPVIMHYRCRQNVPPQGAAGGGTKAN